MTDKSVELVVSALQGVANKLGVASEHLWGVLVGQAFLVGIAWLMFIVVVMVLACYWVKMTKMVYKNVTVGYPDVERPGRYDQWDEAHYLYVAAGWVAIAICCIIILGNMGEILSCFLNPEYWALNKLLCTFSSH